MFIFVSWLLHGRHGTRTLVLLALSLPALSGETSSDAFWPASMDQATPLVDPCWHVSPTHNAEPVRDIHTGQKRAKTETKMDNLDIWLAQLFALLVSDWLKNILSQ